MSAKVSIFLDTRVSKGENIYPLKIRVTFNRIRRYYGIDAKIVNEMLDSIHANKYKYDGLGNYSIDKVSFDKAMAAKPRGVLKELKDIFTKIEIEYQQKANWIKPFSFDVFAAEINNKRPDNEVFTMIDKKIIELESTERIGSALCYTNAKNSLKEFVGSESVPFEYFTVSRLKKYEAWMKAKDNSLTTVGIYLRSLRAVYNEARKLGLTQHYPFSGDGYKIPKGSSRKIALDLDELNLLLSYKFKNEDDPLIYYFDVWRLSYLLNGMNIKDIALLKKENIIGNFIHFVREKTRNTAKEETDIKVYISPEVQEIFDKWGDKNGSEYLIPLFEKKESEREIKRKVSILVNSINQTMEKITAELKFKKRINCYTARHTWATQMMRHGAPVTFIGKQLGHTSTSTTDSYLKGFDDDTIIEWHKKLTGKQSEKPQDSVQQPEVQVS